MPKIIIKTADVLMEADLFSTPTGESIFNSLPLEGTTNVWGEEIYFEIPLALELEPDAKEAVEVGDLGYWPAGPAFCIFFGPTPVSRGEEPRAYSPVNVFGRVLGDARLLKEVPDGARVRVAPAD